MCFINVKPATFICQQQAALMAAAQGTYINPMAALATHATLNGMANSVVPPTSGITIVLFLSFMLTHIQHLLYVQFVPPILLNMCYGKGGRILNVPGYNLNAKPLSDLSCTL